MGHIRPPRPVLAIMAAFSRYAAALEWARTTAQQAWGPIAMASELFEFDATDYYRASMGSGLTKCFFAFEQLMDPAELVARKRCSNEWEEQYLQVGRHPEPRPLNLDPGYLAEAKLILASTKDRDHRIYLGEGIYAEGTLHFRDGGWQTRPWTYPDYQRADYHRFFARCRDYLRERYRAADVQADR